MTRAGPENGSAGGCLEEMPRGSRRRTRGHIGKWELSLASAQGLNTVCAPASRTAGRASTLRGCGVSTVGSGRLPAAPRAEPAGAEAKWAADVKKPMRARRFAVRPRAPTVLPTQYPPFRQGLFTWGSRGFRVCEPLESCVGVHSEVGGPIGLSGFSRATPPHAGQDPQVWERGASPTIASDAAENLQDLPLAASCPPRSAGPEPSLTCRENRI